MYNPDICAVDLFLGTVMCVDVYLQNRNGVLTQIRGKIFLTDLYPNVKRKLHLTRPLTGLKQS